MNGLVRDGVALAGEVARRVGQLGASAPEVVLCPPATLLALVAEALTGSAIALGGQDCHGEISGAHTGDISARMLADLSCRYVIVGHSERRANHHEDNAVVRAKAAAAHAAGLAAIICLGETLGERDGGKTVDVVRRQLVESLPSAARAANTVIAYEPVWAIGTGRNAAPDQIGEVHALIRRELDGRAADAEGVRILYGGSVKPMSAPEVMDVPDVDGVLVGGASLKAEDFFWIVRAAAS